MEMMCYLRGSKEGVVVGGGGDGGRGEHLTLTMGEEVVSKRRGGPGVTISGAHTVTAQGGAELLHACQSFCRGGSECGTRQQPPERPVVGG